MNKRLFLAFIAALFVSTAHAAPVPPATNKDGSFVSGFLTADFDLREGQQAVPFPTNLLFDLANPDLTLGIPFDPNELTAPFVMAVNTLDGWSTTERWTTSFSSFPNQADPGSVIPGQSVRMFEVSTVFGTIVIVNGIVRELTPGVDFVATMISDDTLGIIPLKPLAELTTYMAVLTNDIRDTVGNDATPSQFYHLTKSLSPWVDANGDSTTVFFDNATAASLEQARQITFSMESAAEAAGIPREDIILSWTVQTQSITPVMKLLRSMARPAATEAAPTGQSTAAFGGLGLADISMGIITLPYYLGLPTADNPMGPLTDYWTAEPGAYVPPFDTLGLDPNSTNLTVANPIPVKTGDQTVPMLITTPNANSGHTKPAAGWPVVIFAHGLGGNRTNLLATADSLAAAGFAAICVDGVLHGITPQDTALAALYIENTPWADVANERTFNVDYVDNVTGAFGPDGLVDPSGTHALNLLSHLTYRDNLRQSEIDYSILAVTIPYIDIDGDTLPDFDGSTVNFAGISAGAIVGTVITAIEPTISNSYLSVGMGGLSRGAEASQTFGPPIRASLASLGVLPGTATYELFFTALQTVLDSADPINWAAEAARLRNVLVHEVIGDTVVPNFVPTAPLSGTEPMIATMGLAPYSSTLQNPAGIDAAARFLPPASHSSWLSPATSPAATAEMQKQVGSFFGSDGTAIVVEDAATMVPASVPAEEE